MTVMVLPTPSPGSLRSPPSVAVATEGDCQELRGTGHQLSRSLSTERKSKRFRHPLDVVPALRVLLGGFQVLQHKGCIDRKLRETVKIGLVIDVAATRNHLTQAHLDVFFPFQVFRVARNDPAAQLIETLADDAAVVVHAFG